MGGKCLITLLSRLFIKDRENTSDAGVRRAYGMLCSLVGIGLNVLLFLGKYLAGRLSGSIAMTADAFNNLSDAGSSVITLLGFRMAAIILAEVGNFTRFDSPDKLLAYAGMSSSIYQSG